MVSSSLKRNPQTSHRSAKHFNQLQLIDVVFSLPGLIQPGRWKRVLRCAGVHRASGPWFQNPGFEKQKQVTFHACQLPFVMSLPSCHQACFRRTATVLRLAVLCLPPFSSCLCKCANLQVHKKRSSSLWTAFGCSTTGRRMLRNSRHATTKSDWTGPMTSMGIPKRSLLHGGLSIDLHISTLVVL